MCGTDRFQTHPSGQAVLSQSARVIIHSNEEAIRKSFSNPMITHSTIMCTTPANLRVLDQFVSPDMMERLHAGDVKGALECVGMTAHSESELTSAVTASWLADLDNAKKLYDYKKTITYSSESVRIKALEACEQRIASIESRITAVEDRIKRAKEHTCPICMCDATNPALIPCCAQIFCFGCLCESLKRVASCPLCRQRITDLKSVKVLGDATETNTVSTVIEKKKLGKQESCIEFLKEHPTARVLIFSSYDATFSGLNTALTDAAITHATVNGSQARITKLLREFKEGKHSVLFLNARNMGAGLNMESATHVLLFHRMAAELEQQIVGRAVRLGRTEPLEVIHLFHDNELQTGITHS
jgi:SNF2 family DNA or RNA helicase